MQQITKLPIKNVLSIQSVMIDCCLAYYLEGDWKLVLTRARNNTAGMQRKAIEKLLATDEAGIERLARVLITT